MPYLGALLAVLMGLMVDILVEAAAETSAGQILDNNAGVDLRTVSAVPGGIIDLRPEASIR